MNPKTSCGVLRHLHNSSIRAAGHISSAGAKSSKAGEVSPGIRRANSVTEVDKGHPKCN